MLGKFRRGLWLSLVFPPPPQPHPRLRAAIYTKNKNGIPFPVWHLIWQRECITYSHWHSRQDLIARTPRRQHWQAVPLRRTQEGWCKFIIHLIYSTALALRSIWHLRFECLNFNTNRFTHNRLKKSLTMFVQNDCTKKKENCTKKTEMSH